MIPLSGSEHYFDGQLTALIEIGSPHPGPGGPAGGGTDGKGGGGGKGLSGGVQGNAGNRGANVGGNVGYDLGGANVGMGLGTGGPSLGLGLGGGGGHGGGAGRGGNPAGGGRGDDDGRGAPQQGMANLGPPATINLKFTNEGKVRLEFSVVDFLSPMGNFVVVPEKLTLEPGQWAEVEPMSSQLLAPGSAPTVKLVLRLGARKDDKNIVLHPAQ